MGMGMGMGMRMRPDCGEMCAVFLWFVVVCLWFSWRLLLFWSILIASCDTVDAPFIVGAPLLLLCFLVDLSSLSGVAWH